VLEDFKSKFPVFSERSAHAEIMTGATTKRKLWPRCKKPLPPGTAISPPSMPARTFPRCAPTRASSSLSAATAS